MRRGIAYVYLSLLVATAVAIGVLAVLASHYDTPTNTRGHTEYSDAMATLASMKLVAHYCAARASVDPSVGSQPNLGYTYDLSSTYHVYAESSNRPDPGHVECYNMTKTDGSYFQLVRGVQVTTSVKPEKISLTERFGGEYLTVTYRALVRPVVYVNNSLGVADFKVKIYYKGLLAAEDSGGATVLSASIPVRYAESTLKAGNTTRSYPVKLNQSDDPAYDWVIITSFVLDPTGPGSYTITVNLYLFDGIRQTIEIGVVW